MLCTESTTEHYVELRLTKVSFWLELFRIPWGSVLAWPHKKTATVYKMVLPNTAIPHPGPSLRCMTCSRLQRQKKKFSGRTFCSIWANLCQMGCATSHYKIWHIPALFFYHLCILLHQWTMLYSLAWFVLYCRAKSPLTKGKKFVCMCNTWQHAEPSFQCVARQPPLSIAQTFCPLVVDLQQTVKYTVSL